MHPHYNEAERVWEVVDEDGYPVTVTVFRSEEAAWDWIDWQRWRSIDGAQETKPKVVDRGIAWIWGLGPYWPSSLHRSNCGPGRISTNDGL